MDKSLEKVLKDAMYKPGEELCETLWCTICKKQKAKNISQLWGYSILGLISLSSLVVVVNDISTSFAQSGFYEYLSLISSDAGVITTYWKEFMLSVTESLPITSITLSLFLLLILFVSMRRIVGQYRSQLLLA